MTLLAEKTYTPEELIGDPRLRGHELVGGHLRERHVSKKSCAVGSKIHFLLFTEAWKTREATVYMSDMGYRCFSVAPNMLRYADVSVIRLSRLAGIEEDPAYMPIPADLAVEVLSRNDVISDVDAKVDEYLEAHFAIVWVVNPHRRHVHIYRQDGSVQLLRAEEEITGETALPGFRCKVAEFFDVPT